MYDLRDIDSTEFLRNRSEDETQSTSCSLKILIDNRNSSKDEQKDAASEK